MLEKTLKNPIFIPRQENLEKIVEENSKNYDFIFSLGNKLNTYYYNTKNLFKKIRSKINKNLDSYIPHSLKILKSRLKLKKEDLTYRFNEFTREFIERTLNKLNRGLSYASLLTFFATSVIPINKPVETVIPDPSHYFETFYPQYLEELTSPNLSNGEKLLIIKEILISQDESNDKDLNKETPNSNNVSKKPTPKIDIKIIKSKIAIEKVETYFKHFPTDYLLSNPESVDLIQSLLVQYTLSNDISPIPLAGLFVQESGGNIYAVSPKGAAGLMQLMPATARRYGLRVPYYPTRINNKKYTLLDPIENQKRDERFDPEKSIGAAIAFWLDLEDKFNNLDLELASYNSGENRVKACMCIPNIKETKNFVRRVKSNITEIDNIHEQLRKEQNLEYYLKSIATETEKLPVFSYSSSNSTLVRLILEDYLGEEWLSRHYASLDAPILDIIYKFIEKNKDNKVKTLIDRDSDDFEDSLSKSGIIVFLYDKIKLEHVEGLSLGLNDEGKPLILIPRSDISKFMITGEVKTLEEIERGNFISLFSLYFSNAQRKDLGNKSMNLALN